MENESKAISQFNEAGYQIKRLNNIWVLCAALRERGMYAECRWKLDSAETELWIDIEQEGYKEKIKTINKEIEKASSNINKDLFYRSLIEKEKLLRKVQEKVGKGGKKTDPDEDDMD